MTISRKGFVYRVAYSRLWSSYRPEQVSICKLFWRFLGMAFVLYPLGMFGVVVSYTVLFLFARKGINVFSPTIAPSDSNCVPYKNWPTIRGHRIWPIAILAPLGFILGIVFGSAFITRVGIDLFGPAFITRVGIDLVIFIIFLSIVGLAMLAASGIGTFCYSETAQLIVKYFKAKKEKVCPLIRVTD